MININAGKTFKLLNLNLITDLRRQTVNENNKNEHRRMITTHELKKIVSSNVRGNKFRCLTCWTDCSNYKKFQSHKTEKRHFNINPSQYAISQMLIKSRYCKLCKRYFNNSDSLSKHELSAKKHLVENRSIHIKQPVFKEARFNEDACRRSKRIKRNW